MYVQAFAIKFLFLFVDRANFSMIVFKINNLHALYDCHMCRNKKWTYHSIRGQKDSWRYYDQGSAREQQTK